MFAGMLSGLVLLAVGWLQIREYSRTESEAHARAEELGIATAGLSATNAILNSQLEATRALVKELQGAIDQATQAKSSLEAEFRTALNSRDVTISELQGRLTVNILDRVLFDSGEAVLKPDGEAVLSKVATLLSQYPKRQLQIVGHTDNVPIRSRIQGGFADNWSLSVGRALAAVRYLETHDGVDPHRLAAVGCGEFRPLANNATPEGRARNRRIAIVVLPEEITPDDLIEKPGPPVPSPEPSVEPVSEPSPPSAPPPPSPRTL